MLSPSQSPGPLLLLLGAERVPLRFVASEGSLFVVGTEPSTEWPVRLLRSGRALVERDGLRQEYSVELVAEASARALVMERFRETFGRALVEEWFPTPGRILRLFNDPRTGDADPYGRWIRGEFDAASDEYVRRLLENPVEREARRRSTRFLLRTFAGRRRLLELGSGPGLETLPMLAEGHEVTAVDISPSMLEALRARAREAGVAERLTTVPLRLRDLARLPAGPYDGAYSTFGALNCEPDLGPTVRALADRLPVGAPLVAGYYNRWALAAAATQLASGHLGAAGARLGSAVPVGRSRFSVDWVPHGRREMELLFSPAFSPSGTMGIGFVSPPAEIAPRFRRIPGLLTAMLRWDEEWEGRSMAGWFGDQVLLRMVRTDQAVPDFAVEAP